MGDDVQRKYDDLIYTIVGKAKAKECDGEIFMQFNCNAIKHWLYINEPGIMKLWFDMNEDQVKEEI